MEPRQVEPLGVFGILASQREWETFRSKLEELSERIPEPDRAKVADYLRSGYMTLAIMEISHDVLNRTFEYPGGSAILTDGTYYWRADATEYVLRYGSGLSPDFMAHAQRSNWKIPQMSREEVIAVDTYLAAHIRTPSIV